MGAQNFRHFQGRTNNSVLGQFFFNVPKIQFFFMIFGYFGHFSFLGQKGAAPGARFFTDTCPQGGRRILDI